MFHPSRFSRDAADEIILMFLLPFIFLVSPYTQLVPEDKYLEYILLAVLIMIGLITPTMHSFTMWQPLVMIHYQETLLAVEKTTNAFSAILFHPAASLTPPDAGRELSLITRKLSALEYELKIMSQETLGMVALAFQL